MSFLHDLRYAVRVLLKSPGFSVAAVMVLAAAIGVNTAVFSFVNAFVLRPLPGREKPGEVVGLFSRDRTHPDSYRDFSYPNYVDIRRRAGVFADVAAFSVTFAGIREGDVTRRSLVSPVTSSYFSTIGVALAAGRPFTPEEERPGARAAVAILSHDCWRRQPANTPVLGGTIDLNGRPFTIVGVAPRGFTGTTAAFTPDVWVPTGAWEAISNGASANQSGSMLADRGNHVLMIVGRLRPGMSQEAAAPALSGLAAALEREFPAENRHEELIVATLPRLTMSSRPQSDARSMGYSALVMLIASIVLLVAGMNLANMVMARAAGRQKEVAMRLALGCSRARIVRQLLTEGFVLSVVGGALGLVVAYWSSRLLWASLAARSPVALSFDPAPDVRVLGATLAFCAATTVLFGLGPAWKLSRTEILPQIKAQGGQAGRGRGRRWTGQDGLVAGQFALSLALLITAGLFVRGAWKASTSEPGYRFDGRAVATLDAGLTGWDETRGRAAYRRVVERVRALQVVESASTSSSIAFGTIVESRAVRRAGAGADRAAVDSVLAVVGAEYFRTLGLPMLRGRDFSSGEEQEAGSSRVAIVDLPLARRLFGDEDPVGRQIRVDEQAGEPLLVVGVAPGLRQSLWDKAPVPHLYLPTGQAYRANAHLHVCFRAGTGVAEGLQALRREIRAADEALPVMSIHTMADHRATTTTYWAVGAMAWIFSVFGGLALFLAVVGVYAVKAYLVARRTREIGIRMALGSTPWQVVGLVLREGMGLTAGGLGVGLLTGLAIGKAVSALLYDVSPFDPLVFGATPVALVLAVVAACYLPARRATKIAPVVALRAE